MLESKELNKELLETKENVLNDENLIKEKQVEGNYDKSDSKESNLIQTNHINSIDRIQQLSEYNDILQSAISRIKILMVKNSVNTPEHNGVFFYAKIN